jgi:hypothetical protein
MVTNIGCSSDDINVDVAEERGGRAAVARSARGFVS